MADAEARWYVVHTYSGYENKVKADIEKTIENRGLQDQILEVSDSAADGRSKRKTDDEETGYSAEDVSGVRFNQDDYER